MTRPAGVTVTAAKLLIGICYCTAQLIVNVGKGDFSIMLGILHVWIVHMQLHVTTGMDYC